MKKQLLMLTVFFICCFMFIPQKSKSQTWTLSANFDSGVLGTKADNGGDGFTGAGGKSFYTNEQVFSGGQACKLNIDSGKTGYGSWGGEFIFPKKLTRGDTIWYQVYTYFPSDFDHYSYGEGSRLKFLRIQTHSNTGSNHGYNDLYIDRHDDPNPFKWIYEGAAQWKNVGDPDDLIVKDKWESYQMRITFDNIPLSQGGLAEIFIWKNGILLKHITDRSTFKDSSDYTQRALLFTYWNGGAPKTQSMYVDEITITTALPSGIDAQGNRMIPSLINTTTEIQETTEAKTINVYPNPVSDHVTISSLSSKGQTTVILSNTLGQQIGETMNFTGKTSMQMNTEHLSEGVYLLTVITNNQRFTTKIIK